VSTTEADKCFAELQRLARRYIDAIPPGDGGSVHHAVATCLASAMEIAEHAKTGCEFRFVMADLLQMAAVCYFKSRLPEEPPEEKPGTAH
jgi:hypothetical protein